MQPLSLFPEWLSTLTLQQQAVLMAATRGQDGDPKYTMLKEIMWALRACTMKAAHTGKEVEIGEHLGSFMSLRLFEDGDKWEKHIRKALDHEGDGSNIHYYTHLMHAAEILGYKHPSSSYRRRWLVCYHLMVHKLHLFPETEQQMDERLNDFGREWEQPVQDVAPKNPLSISGF